MDKPILVKKQKQKSKKKKRDQMKMMKEMMKNIYPVVVWN